MSPLVKTIRHEGKTWTVGQTVRIPELRYDGTIISLWPATATKPAFAHVKRDGSIYPRAVTLDKLEAVE
jgi:hypothetical protein